MKEILKNKKLEMFQFVLYNIVLGIFGWIAFSFFIAFENKPKYTIYGELLYFFMAISITTLYAWFFFITLKRCKWHVFNEYTDIIAKCIAAGTIMLLAITIGVFKIPF